MSSQVELAGLSFPVEPMLAATAEAVPEGAPGAWAYEPKFDGFVRHEVHVIEGGGRPLRRIVAAVW